MCLIRLTLYIEHPLHADVWHPLFAQLSTDAEHLVGVRRHNADAPLVQLAPGHWPLAPHLLHAFHYLKHLWRTHTHTHILLQTSLHTHTHLYTHHPLINIKINQPINIGLKEAHILHCEISE